MTFGERITTLRKKKKWSQNELAQKVGTSAPIIGRYERGEIKPSIEVAAKLADLLEVSLDYLVGNTDTEVNPDMLKRVIGLQNLSAEDQDTAIKFLDAFLRDASTKKNYVG